MESPINSSFIPTKISLSERPREEYGSDAFDVVVLLGVIALVVAGTMAAGVFLYKQFASNELAAKKAQLNKAKEAFQPNLVRDLARLDERISIAEGILQTHIAPSAFFDILQQLTLRSVQFHSMNFDTAVADKLHIKMDGKAASVNSVAYQSSVFGGHPAIKNSIFSIGSIAKDGVDFVVEFDLSPEAINFATLVSAAATGSQSQNEGFVPNDSSEGNFEEESASEQSAPTQLAPRGEVRGSADVGMPTRKPQGQSTKKKAADELFGEFE
jgi:hypothetical protein